MSDVSFSDVTSVSEPSDPSSASSSSSSSSSASSSFDSTGDNSSHSVQDYSFRGTMDESRDQSSDLGAPLSAGRIARMMRDMRSIRRYCEELNAQVDNIFDTTTTSTPTGIQGRRRGLDVTPVEVIDLSNFELAPPARPPANRAPDAVIDLCTPDRSNTTHRRALQQSTSNAAVVDLDDPSPPKRSCPNLDQSQKEESYKCPVCLENVRRREPVSTKCGHVFCKDCLVAAINSVHKCPLCNKKMTLRQFSRIYL